MTVMRSLQQVCSRALTLAVVVAATACGPAPQSPAPPTAAGSDWREFSGTWSAAGSRRTIPLGGDRKASIVGLQGTMLLAGAGRPDVGFRSEILALVDTQMGLVGRGVWTDERGDQIFSEVKGQGTAAQNRIEGTLVGGTGRYAGATGSYEFSWQFVIETDDGSIQGRAVGLKGRVRAGQPDTGGPPK